MASSGIRVVHAADIHLDSPMLGIANWASDAAENLRQATRGALLNLVDLVIAQEAQLLLIPGDLYDGTWDNYATGAFFIDEMRRLGDEGVDVVVVSGNHDAESKITQTLKLPDNVHLLSTKAPESKVFDDLGVVVHGQGYRERDVQVNLAERYPDAVPNMINIGLLHTAATGAEGHANYAPCSPEDLRRLEYHYMALGHVHQRGAVLEGDRPAWFSGNLQGRHVRETGPKGALIVDLHLDDPTDVRFHTLDEVRWEQIEVDLTAVRSLDDVWDTVEDQLRMVRGGVTDRSLVARVNLVGTTSIAGELRRLDWLDEDHQIARTARELGLVLEKVKLKVELTRPPDRELGKLRHLLAEVAEDLLATPTPALQVLEQLKRDIRKIINEPRVGEPPFEGEENLRELLTAARKSLDSRLASASTSTSVDVDADATTQNYVEGDR